MSKDTNTKAAIAYHTLEAERDELRVWLQWCLDNCDDSPEFNFGTEATEKMRALLANKAAHDAEQAQEPVALTPEWLWVQLMDWCKRRGSNPSEYNDLFRIVMSARAFLAAAPAPEAQPEPDDRARAAAIAAEHILQEDYGASLPAQPEMSKAQRVERLMRRATQLEQHGTVYDRLPPQTQAAGKEPEKK